MRADFKTTTIPNRKSVVLVRTSPSKDTALYIFTAGITENRRARRFLFTNGTHRILKICQIRTIDKLDMNTNIILIAVKLFADI